MKRDLNLIQEFLELIEEKNINCKCRFFNLERA